jgi:hypothetical protein
MQRTVLVTRDRVCDEARNGCGENLGEAEVQSSSIGANPETEGEPWLAVRFAQ